jgi:hypothetical protein
MLSDSEESAHWRSLGNNSRSFIVRLEPTVVVIIVQVPWKSLPYIMRRITKRLAAANSTERLDGRGIGTLRHKPYPLPLAWLVLVPISNPLPAPSYHYEASLR